MKIQVLGIACPECDRVVANVAEALAALGLDADIEQIEDPRTVKSMGIYATPALIIDGEVKIVGAVPTVDQIKRYLQSHPAN